MNKSPGDEVCSEHPMMTEADRNKGRDGVVPDRLKANTESTSVQKGLERNVRVLPGAGKVLVPSLTLSNNEDTSGEGQCFPENRRSKGHS